MTGAHIPFEQRLGHDPSEIDPSGNMHYDLFANRTIFDKTPKGPKRQQVLIEDFNETTGQFEAVLVDKDPLQAVFNPQKKRFDLINTQTIFDPHEKHTTKIWDDVEF